MPAGRKRDRITRAFEILMDEKIQGRVASFDTAVAEQTAELMAARKQRGHPQDYRDTMIAGIVLSSKATLATRNTAHFEDLSVRVVNPWKT
jgi:predicted nucleic acid-binding protein